MSMPQKIDAGNDGNLSASPRTYITRTGPLADVWESELEPMLKKQPELLPITLFEYLQDKYMVLKKLVILIAGMVLSFRLSHFRLAYSKWSYLQVVQGGESYIALAEGTSESLKRLGAVPKELRTDSLSVAFRNLSTNEATTF
jgi:hypothetical protein